MTWLRDLLRRDHGPDERSRKGAELLELRTESTQAIQRAEESKRLANALRNTVNAMRSS